MTHIFVSVKLTNSWPHAEYLEYTHMHVLCLCYDLTSSKWSNTWPFISIMRSSVTAVFFFFFYTTVSHVTLWQQASGGCKNEIRRLKETGRNLIDEPHTVMLSVLTQCTKIWHLTWELLCLKHPLNNNSLIKSHHFWKCRNMVYRSSLTIHLNIFN